MKKLILTLVLFLLPTLALAQFRPERGGTHDPLYTYCVAHWSAEAVAAVAYQVEWKQNGSYGTANMAYDVGVRTFNSRGWAAYTEKQIAQTCNVVAYS